MSGTIRPEIVLPVDRDGIRAHLRHALSLGLPTLLEQPPSVPPAMHIVANGPSSATAALDAGWYAIAVNGALALYTERGMRPAFWVCCDPQARVAEFLDRAPRETVYLVASQCHPAVFEALAGRDVRLWHVADRNIMDLLAADAECVLGGSSVTLRTLSLFARLGVQHFQTRGWDGCFLDGRDHAVPQPHEAERITVVVGERRFASTHAWALEAGQAVHQVSRARYSLTVHGPGMIGAMLRHARLPQLFSLQ